MRRFLCTLALAAAAAHAADKPLAATPPMGWNSWDSYGTTVTEQEVLANAAFMAKNLKQAGWEYIVVDIQWSDANAKAHGYRPNAELEMDGNGRLIPASNRFPSSSGGRGFKPMADKIHALGLKFGIHIMRGIPRRAVAAKLPVFGSKYTADQIADPASTCRWNTDMYGIDMTKPGAQDYYDSILKLYAGWGVDYIKADDIARPEHRDEIAALHRAIQKTGRPIVLSLSPGPATRTSLDFLQENANLWRVSDDFWDNWRSLRHMFGLLSPWAGVGRPGAWPDADMLPLGHIGIRAERGDDRISLFTHDEVRTVMTLWSIGQSPLMFGGDLPTTDPFTLSMITNAEALAVNQKGLRGKPISETGDQSVWMADAPDPQTKYVAVFNLGEEPAQIKVSWPGSEPAASCRARDLWSKKDLGDVKEGLTFTVPPHGSELLKLTRVK